MNLIPLVLIVLLLAAIMWIAGWLNCLGDER